MVETHFFWSTMTVCFLNDAIRPLMSTSLLATTLFLIIATWHFYSLPWLYFLSEFLVFIEHFMILFCSCLKIMLLLFEYWCSSLFFKKKDMYWCLHLGDDGVSGVRLWCLCVWVGYGTRALWMDMGLVALLELQENPLYRGRIQGAGTVHEPGIGSHETLWLLVP